ncbi:MAG: hydroxyacylglutathione hydrolase [Pseudorhodobacter sp.]
MPLDLVTVPCLKDNYAFLIHDRETGATAVVDVPEAGPILSALAERGWTLTDVLLTHHHWDHVDGLPDLLEELGAAVTVWGAEADTHRLPPLDRAVAEGQTHMFGSQKVRVMDVSGHTVGHIAFHFPGAALLFSGDSLMAMGCGRLFEGTPAQMWRSLQKIAALPDETLICSGHEYTTSNMRFAISLEPGNEALILRQEDIDRARAADEPTVPSTLALERQTNPFLRAADPVLKSAVGMPDAAPDQVFAEIRGRKDRF